MSHDFSDHRVMPLLALVRSGNDAAFESLLSLYEPLLLSSVSSFSESTSSRDELMQEARYALYRAAISYSEGGVSFGLYAKICIRNALISVMRRERARPLPFSLDLLGEQDAPSLDADVDVLDDLIRLEAAHMRLRSIFEVLSPYERRVFSLYAAGDSPAEIAVKLSRDERSVQNAVSRMMMKVRRLGQADEG